MIKFRESVLNESTGKRGYQTKWFDLVPEKLNAEKKEVSVQNDVVVIKNKDNSIECVRTPVKSLNNGREVTNIDKSHTDFFKYRCVYCDTSERKLQSMIDHCVKTHEDHVLKYKELCVDSITQQLGYRSKLHEGIVPSRVKRSGKSIVVHENMVLIKDSKKQMLNTPVKQNFVSTNSKNIDDLAELHKAYDDYSNVELNKEKAFEEMENLLPKVLNTLFESGKLHSYLKFNRLLANKELPMNNICFLLFTDLVEWFSCNNTSMMRYQAETVQFWRIGYRLFHGKFLRFMSGLRNSGQVLDKEAERGDLDPTDSRINFAVPAKQNLYRKEDKVSPMYPGIFEKQIEALAEQFSGKPLKLCVDGKKISRGKGNGIGDIDCWGYESIPSLKEKRQTHKQSIDRLNAIQIKIDALAENGNTIIQDLSTHERADLISDLKYEIESVSENNKLLREKQSSLEQMEKKFKN
ncbi:MAG: hypothetical protein AB2693_35060, partial [Candidatus Thiodiazotropha sp.]